VVRDIDRDVEETAVLTDCRIWLGVEFEVVGVIICTVRSPNAWHKV
jgi:hypothetical protein